jgi:peptide/nickel transport system permease protein
MHRYLIQRLLASFAVLLVVVTVTFAMVQVAPGGLSILMSPDLPPAEAERLAANLGLDRPILVQYGQWIGNFLTGDLGQSLSYGGRSVLRMVTERLPATLLLGGTAALVTLLVGVPLGILAARRQDGPVDQIVSLLSSIGLATPNFWLGILLIVLFSVQLGWLPSSGTRTIGGDGGDLLDRLRHLILPVIVLATSSLAELVRYTRSSWLETLRLDYVLVARSKGLDDAQVDRRHILKNALIPVVTVFGVSLPRLVGGSAIVETLFSWPGLGQLAVDASLRRDTPLILGITIFVSVAVVLANLLIDLLYPLLDPRIQVA